MLSLLHCKQSTRISNEWGLLFKAKGKIRPHFFIIAIYQAFPNVFCSRISKTFCFSKILFWSVRREHWPLRPSRPPPEKCRAGIAKSVHFYRKKACCLDSMTPIQFFYSFRATFRTFTWCLELTVTGFNVLSPPRWRPAPPVENFGAYSRLSNPYKSNI